MFPGASWVWGAILGSGVFHGPPDIQGVEVGVVVVVRGLYRYTVKFPLGPEVFQNGRYLLIETVAGIFFFRRDGV